MKIMLVSLLLVLFTVSSTTSLNLREICQSGIRDDGTNYVHCARKSLHEIPTFNSNRLFNLAFDELILSDNLITHIPGNAFLGLRIKRLVMSGNRLKSLDRFAFRELENYLEELILEFDPSIVDKIPQAIEMNLINIRSLTLIGLNLHRLPSNSFRQMRKLESLALKSCHLQTIEFNAFHSLEHQLRHLDFSSNQLSKEIFAELHRLTQLESLSLAQNSIEDFSMKDLNQHLKSLDLSYNQLKKLTLIHLNRLESFHLQNNLLTSENIVGVWPRHLKELILDFNAVHSFEKHQFDPANSLEILSLQSNEFLLHNAEIFQYFHRLKTLNLARNNIQTIPHGLFHWTPLLEDLNLDRNPLLPLSIDTFIGIEQTLRNFSCQSCSLTSSSLVALSPLQHLERLKLQSNFLNEIQPRKLFLSMNKLKLIDLQRNQLTQIPSQWPLTLRELQLANNRLTTLTIENETLSLLNTLDLSQNPLHCDCHLKDFYRWLVEHFQQELVPYVQWICATPKQVAGNKLGSLNDSNFICDQKMISSFDIWFKDLETIVLEWTFVNIPFIDQALELKVKENERFLPVLRLNTTENYFVLEKLKPSTNYFFCLQIGQQTICRNLTTRTRPILSLSSKKVQTSSSSSSSTFLLRFDMEYLIVAISLAIIVILIILVTLILFLVKQRHQYPPSLKTTSVDSYYQTTGSETTQIAFCHHSMDDRSSQLLPYPSTPIFCTCHRSSIDVHDSSQPTYHFYHEIPLYKAPTII